MPWVRYDDGFYDHPKVVALGRDLPLGVTLLVFGSCYASRHLTDGFIPDGQVARLVARPQPEIDRVVKRLIELDLWTRVQGGYAIHDYLVYNPSRAHVLSERQAAKERRDARRPLNGQANVG